MTVGQATHSVCHKALCTSGFQGYLTVSIGRDNTSYILHTYIQQEEKFCKMILSLTTCSALIFSFHFFFFFLSDSHNSLTHLMTHSVSWVIIFSVKNTAL